jgi:hypothetical protein
VGGLRVRGRSLHLATSFLINEVDDSDHRFLGDLLQLRDQGSGFLDVARDQVPHKDEILLSEGRLFLNHLCAETGHITLITQTQIHLLPD